MQQPTLSSNQDDNTVGFEKVALKIWLWKMFLNEMQ